MGQFEDLLLRGFGMLKSVMETPTLTANGVTRDCLSTAVMQTKELRDAGFWPAFGCVCELAREDFQSLGIVDRTILLFKGVGIATSKRLKVMGIEDDPADPCVKVTLKEEPAS